MIYEKSTKQSTTSTTKSLMREQAKWDKYGEYIEKCLFLDPDWYETHEAIQVYRDGNGNLVIDDGDDLDLLGL